MTDKPDADAVRKALQRWYDATPKYEIEDKRDLRNALALLDAQAQEIRERDGHIGDLRTLVRKKDDEYVALMVVHDAQAQEIARIREDRDSQQRLCIDAMIERDAALRERDALRAELIEAANDIADWGAYASPYFQEKYDLAGDIARYLAIAEQGGKE